MTDLETLVGTWRGRGELWLDPLGDAAQTCDVELDVAADSVTYRWSYEGKPQTGRVAITPDGATFTDTWHQPTSMPCAAQRPTWALIDVAGRYGAGEGPDWGWGLTLSRRPDDTLVLQMTNVAPWGEHGRAVRMIATRG